MLKHLVFTTACLFSFSTLAYSPDYYTVRETTSSFTENSFNPFDTFEELSVQATAQILNLLNWQHHAQALEDPRVPYDRLAQYGTWVKDPRDGTCYDTRAKVLIRQSEVPVRFNSRGCSVISGKWLDPYSDRIYTQASDLQIDHVVPLKNSYISGAWKWDSQKRCLYANFLQNDFHLLAVNGNDNMKKGDRSPEEFMPDNATFSCEYLSSWLKIKLIWNLAMTPSEALGIEQLAKENHCDASDMSFKVKDLRAQRQSILTNMELCSHATH
jgi:hypothetical protein